MSALHALDSLTTFRGRVLPKNVQESQVLPGFHQVSETQCHAIHFIGYQKTQLLDPPRQRVFWFYVLVTPRIPGDNGVIS